MTKFTFFWDGWASQWHSSPFVSSDFGDPLTFGCAEQYMMAAKAIQFDDAQSFAKIMVADYPRQQKSLGRSVANFDGNVWRDMAPKHVYRGSFQKFHQNPELMRSLLATAGTWIVEASPEDRIWGIGLRESDPRANIPGQWEGSNWLGRVLMQVRDDIINERDQMCGNFRDIVIGYGPRPWLQ